MTWKQVCLNSLSGWEILNLRKVNKLKRSLPSITTSEMPLGSEAVRRSRLGAAPSSKCVYKWEVEGWRVESGCFRQPPRHKRRLRSMSLLFSLSHFLPFLFSCSASLLVCSEAPLHPLTFNYTQLMMPSCCKLNPLLVS